MQNDGKYVPPALRGAGDGASEGRSNNYNGRYGGKGDESNYGGYGRSNGFDRGGRGYTNNRWTEDNDGGFDRRGGGYDRRGGGGGYDRRGGYGSGYGGGGGYDRRGGGYGGSRGGGARKNELGFHGEMRPDPRLEQELFHKEDTQTAGINFDKYDNIPVEVSSGCPDPVVEFSVDTIGVQLMKNLVLTKYLKPTPIQKYSIPIGINGGDMMACAQTGSGKTAGFLFPVISVMLRTGGQPEPEDRPGRRSCYIHALVLAPTRELASQIYEEANKFCYCTGIRPVVVYGGANIQDQQRQLERGADILVATPGRLVDLIERGRVRLDNVRFLVLDEADRMLDMGFEPQIRRIVQEEGMPLERQTFMFSATFPVEIQRLAGDFMKDYFFVAVGRVGAACKDVTQRIEWVEQHDKIDFTIDFLTRVPEGLVLVFVETKRGADHLEDVLMRNNFPASSIHGDKSQREREDALRLFKSGRTPILVATDVAARGLDIPNVTQVINFDLPSNIDDYVHRIGRTGRVGNTGAALSLMNDKNRNVARELADLLEENDQDLPAWLHRMGSFGGRGGGGRGRGRGRGGGGFGARDYRKESGGRGGRGGGGYAGGGSSGYGGGGYGGGGGVSRGGGGNYNSEPPMPYGGARPPDSWQFSDNSAW